MNTQKDFDYYISLLRSQQSPLSPEDVRSLLASKAAATTASSFSFTSITGKAMIPILVTGAAIGTLLTATLWQGAEDSKSAEKSVLSSAQTLESQNSHNATILQQKSDKQTAVLALAPNAPDAPKAPSAPSQPAKPAKPSAPDVAGTRLVELQPMQMNELGLHSDKSLDIYVAMPNNKINRITIVGGKDKSSIRSFSLDAKVPAGVVPVDFEHLPRFITDENGKQIMTSFSQQNRNGMSWNAMTLSSDSINLRTLMETDSSLPDSLKMPLKLNGINIKIGGGNSQNRSLNAMKNITVNGKNIDINVDSLVNSINIDSLVNSIQSSFNNELGNDEVVINSDTVHKIIRKRNINKVEIFSDQCDSSTSIESSKMIFIHSEPNVVRTDSAVVKILQSKLGNAVSQRPLFIENIKAMPTLEEYKAANKLVPVSVIHNSKKYVLWYDANDAFVTRLPEQIGSTLCRELELSASVDDVCTAPLSDEQKKFIAGDSYLDVWRSCANAFTIESVFPNPAQGQTNVKIAIKEARSITATLHTISGELVKTCFAKQAVEPGMRTFQIPLDNIRPGVYLLTMTTEKGEQAVQRVLVQ